MAWESQKEQVPILNLILLPIHLQYPISTLKNIQTSQQKML